MTTRRQPAGPTIDPLVQDTYLEYSPEEYPSLVEFTCAWQADVVYGTRFR